MKKIIILLGCIAAVSACDGDKTYSDVQDMLLDYQKTTVDPQFYTIMGEVKCPACRSYDVMFVNVENTDGSNLISLPWQGEFSEGAFKIQDISLVPGSKIIVRVSIGSILPQGKTEEIEVPKENKEAVSVKISV